MFYFFLKNIFIIRYILVNNNILSLKNIIPYIFPFIEIIFIHFKFKALLLCKKFKIKEEILKIKKLINEKNSFCFINNYSKRNQN